jgi:hypothetical protein
MRFLYVHCVIEEEVEELHINVVVSKEQNFLTGVIGIGFTSISLAA